MSDQSKDCTRNVVEVNGQKTFSTDKHALYNVMLLRNPFSNKQYTVFHCKDCGNWHIREI